MKLAELAVRSPAHVTRVLGAGSFRRRLMELGVLPGTRVEVMGVAPLGDPIELLVRGSSLSIRRADAECVEVVRLLESELRVESARESIEELAGVRGVR
ncbi:MAG TPA: FeoA domain-containing protein [Polyangiaceae bacterium]|nr:FeoA domain-containing protein [Polyangiaceae bacterium]